VRRFALALTGAVSLAFALATPVLAAPEDRGGSGLAVPPAIVIARQSQEVQALQAELVSVSGERDQLQQQRDALRQQVADLQGQVATLTAYTAGGGALSQPVMVPGLRLGPFDPGKFAYGNCTYYVASWRQIPWTGNAGAWFANAQSYGFAEGQAPRVGAIEVSAASIWGHVALVAAVYGPDAWLVREMNYAGFNLIDQRVVYRTREPLIGFIY
jgi:hypothetical protein